MAENLPIYLNGACIGPSSLLSGPQAFAKQQLDLHRALINCIEWAEQWSQARNLSVLLTSGATDACDAAVRAALSPDVKLLFMTDHAHPTVRGCVRQSTQFLSRMFGTSVEISEIALEPLLTLPEEEFARALIDRVQHVSCGVQTLLVIEHVTSLLGIRVPVEIIDRQICEKNLPIRLIVDGAQAVGAWHPWPEMTADYFGSFHKYMDCPAGTGFLAIREVDLPLLPYDVISLSRQYLTSNNESCQTIPGHNWIECSKRLSEISPTTDRAARLLALRDQLVNTVGQENIRPRMAADSPYRSHIVSFNCGSHESAMSVWNSLLDKGYETKCEQGLIRVTLHHSLTESQVDKFGRLLRRSLHQILA